MNDTEVRIMGYCSECGNEITDDMEDIYIDDEGRYFCSSECAMVFYCIHKLEC